MYASLLSGASFLDYANAPFPQTSAAGSGGGASDGGTSQANGAADPTASPGSTAGHTDAAADPNSGAPQSTSNTQGQSISMAPSADVLDPVVVTSQSTANQGSLLTQGPLLAQDPIVDYFLENGGRTPNAADYAARYSKFGTGTQVPKPLPPVPPQNPWILFFQLFRQKLLDFWDFTPSVLIVPCSPGVPCAA
jgi:hypothetical protein